MLGKAGPFPSLFLFCIGFPNFSRIFTTTLWKPPRDAEGAVWLSGPFLVSWLPLSPNFLGLTTMWLKAVLGFSILSHKRFPRLWLCKAYCSVWSGELIDDSGFLDNEFQPVESMFHGGDWSMSGCGLHPQHITFPGLPASAVSADCGHLMCLAFGLLAPSVPVATPAWLNHLPGCCPGSAPWLAGLYKHSK